MSSSFWDFKKNLAVSSFPFCAPRKGTFQKLLLKANSTLQTEKLNLQKLSLQTEFQSKDSRQ
jgi:hypothetical protein